MQQTFVIEKHRLGLVTRLFILAVCGPFFLLGVYASVETVVASLRWVFGTPVEGHIMYGVIIGFTFTLVGALGVWMFFQPQETLTFERATRRATLVRRYPFGRTSTKVFPFDEMALPEVVWITDTDMVKGGYWALKVKLPDGMEMTKAHFHHDGQQKAKAEAWCVAVLEVMVPA